MGALTIKGVKRKSKTNSIDSNKKVETDKNISDEMNYEVEVAKVKSKLDLTPNGRVENSISNIYTVLENDPYLKDRIRYNSFAEVLEPKSGIKWRGNWDDSVIHEFWSDNDTAALNVYIGRTYKISNKSALEDSLTTIGMDNSYHPIREYLDSLIWDGVPRVETFFHKILGSEDTNLNREITKMFFKGSVARPKYPGIKFDYALTLFGEQGLGKSYIFDKLARKWFNDTTIQMGSADSYIANTGSWITEHAEGASSKKADIETMKAFITKREDKVRMPYGRRFSYLKRQGTMVITTNDNVYFKDTTGNRRFPIIEVGVEEIDEDYVVGELTDDFIDQVWAEAVRIYEEDSALKFTEEIKGQLERVVNRYTDWVIPMDELINFLKKQISSNWYRLPVETRRNEMGIPPSDESIFRKYAHVKREYVCVADIVEEYLGRDWKEYKNSNKKGFNQILDQLKQIPGLRRASKKHGDPATKNFGVNGVHRTYFIIENLD